MIYFIFAGTAAAIAAMIWVVWANTALVTSELTICSSRLPAAFDGFRIAQISDLHNAEFGEHNTLLLQKLSAANPDIIVLTGDIIDARHTNVPVGLEFAKNAVKIAPTYYVPGNHEASIAAYESFKNGLQKAGVTVLEDRCISIKRDGAQLGILGLADPNFTTADAPFEAVAMQIEIRLHSLMNEKNSFTIVLSHRPEFFESYTACDVDLVFCGHAHGGQVRLPWVGGLFAPNQGLFPKYDAGVFTNDHTSMIVSRGIGKSIIPLRFCNRPEIVVAQLKAI